MDDLTGFGGFGGGVGSGEAMLGERLSNLNASLEQAEAKEALVEAAERMRHERHVAALHRLVAQVEAALGKVRDGSYGKCDACGGEITRSELEHEPATTLCASCRKHQADHT